MVRDDDNSGVGVCTLGKLCVGGSVGVEAGGTDAVADRVGESLWRVRVELRVCVMLCAKRVGVAPVRVSDSLRVTRSEGVG